MKMSYVLKPYQLITSNASTKKGVTDLMPLKRPDNAAFANENVYTFIRIIINNFGTASFNVNALNKG